VGPSLTLTWAGGVSTSYDLAHTTSNALNANNLFRTTSDQQSANLAFAFRPPARLVRLKNLIRGNLRYAESDNALCLQTVGQNTCVPYVDSHQSQLQLTLDTEFPPSLTAGFQMAYQLNDERQFNHKTSQLVITAFVNMSTSVGQIR
jgi:hypothetical protein